MRIGLLTEGGYPDASGEAHAWCDRLVRGLTGHDFEVYALSADARQEARPRPELPEHVRLVHRAPLWGDFPVGHRRAAEERKGRTPGRRARRRFAERFGDLVTAFATVPAGSGPASGAPHGGAPTGDPPSGPESAPDTPVTRKADRFAAGLYGLAELAREHGGLPAMLHSEGAVRILEAVCHGPRALPAAQGAQVNDLLAVTDRLELALRPLSLDWYGDRHTPGLGGVDLCHATSGGAAALPGLLAKRFFGTPLLVTEYGVRLREHYLARAASPLSVPVRALLAAFQGALAAETYAQAALITPGNTHARRWQERCGADRARLRTVYPGMDAAPFAAVADAAADDSKTLVWVGKVEPAKDLIALLHAFAEVRKAEPAATLRIIGGPGRDPRAPGYLAHCRALAAQLFPDEAADARTVGESPVSFEEIGSPEVPALEDAYASGAVVVLSSVIEGFPRSLVEAMFCGRATVSTDAGAVCEVIGGTGLVVPPRNPRALAEACAALLADPDRRARLGAAARARALELFTVEQNVAAFRGIYLELISRAPARPAACRTRDAHGVPRPFARPAESHVPGRWAATGTAARAATVPAGRTPSWAASEAGRPAAVPVADGARTETGGGDVVRERGQAVRRDDTAGNQAWPARGREQW
ncbi:transferase [Streptomyces platensis subsp. clarensis]|nr:transferase [Streptomyces platensis subsp. clarensis]